MPFPFRFLTHFSCIPTRHSALGPAQPPPPPPPPPPPQAPLCRPSVGTSTTAAESTRDVSYHSPPLCRHQPALTPSHAERSSSLFWSPTGLPPHDSLADVDERMRMRTQSRLRPPFLLGVVRISASSYKPLSDTIMPPRPLLLQSRMHCIQPHVSPPFPVRFSKALASDEFVSRKRTRFCQGLTRVRDCPLYMTL
jgi:hypothetical protein